jgi:asparagine synthase (glutamine-hydrolysing)
MAGIAGPGMREQVERMLDKIAYRGPAGREVLEIEGATLGLVWTEPQASSLSMLTQHHAAQDDRGGGHFAEARVSDDKLVLKRDALGVAPLYYGWTGDHLLCFASEVKALPGVTNEIHELPPGHSYDGSHMERYFHLRKQEPVHDPPERIARELRRHLAASVEKRVVGDELGSWLSGGLDSSTLAALARPYLRKLHTFAAGLIGAPDLEYAREVADLIGSDHHELVVSVDDMLDVLPDVIYHLESFDALLVRSSVTNYLVAQLASKYVSTVFSGEAGDELFAGYEYLKSLDPAKLPDELIDITGRLHNTAFQRVDRCASAHGTVAQVAFADPGVLDYALRIPAELKLHNGTEKWILRRAMDGVLPARALNRAKAKFWDGAGVRETLYSHAEREISDDEFSRERILGNGWLLNSKEELLYYRIFRQQFGDFPDLSWMGRTKGAPVS